MSRKYPGGITVFFSMTISVLILLFTVMFSLEQYMAARIRGKQAVDLCGQSVLGGYLEPLQVDYGLYAVESAAVAEADFRYFWEKNMERYDLDKVEYVTRKTLSDPAVFRSQLYEFMKYYAVEDLLEDYTELMDQAKDSSEAAGDLDEGSQAAVLMETYQQYFASTVEYLSGVDLYGGRYERYISGFWNETRTKEVFRELLDGKGNEGSFNEWLQYFEEYRILNQDAEETFRCLCEEGARIYPEIEKLQETAETEELQEELRKILNSLHTGDASDQQKIEALGQNGQLLEKAIQGLEQLLEDPQSEEGYRKAAVIVSYETNITIPYELRSGSGGQDWSALLNDLQKYITDLSEYAEDRSLLDEETASSLPSGGSADAEAVGDPDLSDQTEDFCNEIKEGPGMTLQKILEIEYTIHTFSDLSGRIERDQADTDHFFQNEVEYILCGSGNELNNIKYVRNRILMMRFVCNAAFLLTDAEKQRVIKTAAALTGGLIAPGLGNLIAEALITTCWATAESYLDYEKLIHGCKVPLVKSKKSWQTDLDDLDQLSWDSKSYQNMNGLTYQDYEKILLLLMDQEKMEGRMMDLVQLNLQKKTGAGIRLKDMVTGFSCTAKYRSGPFSITTGGTYEYR